MSTVGKAAAASLIALALFIPVASSAKSSATKSDFDVSRAEAEKLVFKVDSLIKAEFYSTELAKTVWAKALAENKETILQSKNLKELAE